MTPHMLARLHAIGHYQGHLKMWIRALKFQHQLLYAEALAKCFAASLSTRTDKLPTVILPAPLHIQGYVTRHFNQATEIAHAIARITGQSVKSEYLLRSKNTMSQKALGRINRIRNVSQAFVAAKLPAQTQHVAIVDDVLTTGATMQAMIDALKCANPTVEIEAWVMAIALPHFNQG